MSQQWRDDFLTHLATERRLADLTCHHYRRDIDALLGLLRDQSLAALSAADVRRFVATLHSRGLSGKSLARVLSAWRSFFKFLNRGGMVTNNPCVGIKAPRSPKRLPNVLSPDEASRLLEIAPDSFLAARDLAMFELVYSSGLRVSEVASLKSLDLDPHAGEVRVTGKGGKTRIVPVGQFALKAIVQWTGWRVESARSSGHLFVSRRGEPLTTRAIEYRVAALAKKQGLTERVYPHMLRHSFASHVLQSSGDLRAVQEMLGHANISTTQIYTHLDYQHLAKVYDAAHPRAKRKKGAARE